MYLAFLCSFFLVNVIVDFILCFQSNCAGLARTALVSIYCFFHDQYDSLVKKNSSGCVLYNRYTRNFSGFSRA